MKNNYLYANTHFTRKASKLIPMQAWEEMIHASDKNTLNSLLHAYQYDVSDVYDTREHVDDYIKRKEMELYQEYVQFSCTHLISVLKIEETLLEDTELSKYNEKLLSYYSEELKKPTAAIQAYCKLKIDQILLILYMREHTAIENLLVYANGNIEHAMFERLYKKERSVQEVLQASYGTYFDEALEAYFYHKDVFALEQAFEKKIAATMYTFRFDVIGENALFFYAYAKLQEFKNIRMLLKARIYYVDEEVQKRMVREVYV